MEKPSGPSTQKSKAIPPSEYELAVDAQLSQLKSWKELIQVISKAAKTDDDILLRRWSLHQDPSDVVLAYNTPDKSGSTPLFTCAWFGCSKAARALLESGANPNHCNLRQNTPLHLACERGHRDVIRLLLQFGADVSHANAQNRLPTSPPLCAPEIADFVEEILNELECAKSVPPKRRRAHRLTRAAAHFKFAWKMARQRRLLARWLSDNHTTMLKLSQAQNSKPVLSANKSSSLLRLPPSRSAPIAVGARPRISRRLWTTDTLQALVHKRNPLCPLSSSGRGMTEVELSPFNGSYPHDIQLATALAIHATASSSQGQQRIVLGTLQALGDDNNTHIKISSFYQRPDKSHNQLQSRPTKQVMSRLEASHSPNPSLDESGQLPKQGETLRRALLSLMKIDRRYSAPVTLLKSLTKADLAYLGMHDHVINSVSAAHKALRLLRHRSWRRLRNRPFNLTLSPSTRKRMARSRHMIADKLVGNLKASDIDLFGRGDHEHRQAFSSTLTDTNHTSTRPRESRHASCIVSPTGALRAASSGLSPTHVPDSMNSSSHDISRHLPEPWGLIAAAHRQLPLVGGYLSHVSFKPHFLCNSQAPRRRPQLLSQPPFKDLNGNGRGIRNDDHAIITSPHERERREMAAEYHRRLTSARALGLEAIVKTLISSTPDSKSATRLAPENSEPSARLASNRGRDIINQERAVTATEFSEATADSKDEVGESRGLSASIMPAGNYSRRQSRVSSPGQQVIVSPFGFLVFYRFSSEAGDAGCDSSTHKWTSLTRPEKISLRAVLAQSARTSNTSSLELIIESVRIYVDENSVNEETRLLRGAYLMQSLENRAEVDSMKVDKYTIIMKRNGALSAGRRLATQELVTRAQSIVTPGVLSSPSRVNVESPHITSTDDAFQCNLRENTESRNAPIGPASTFNAVPFSRPMSHFPTRTEYEHKLRPNSSCQRHERNCGDTKGDTTWDIDGKSTVAVADDDDDDDDDNSNNNNNNARRSLITFGIDASHLGSDDLNRRQLEHTLEKVKVARRAYATTEPSDNATYNGHTNDTRKLDTIIQQLRALLVAIDTSKHSQRRLSSGSFLDSKRNGQTNRSLLPLPSRLRCLLVRSLLPSSDIHLPRMAKEAIAIAVQERSFKKRLRVAMIALEAATNAYVSAALSNLRARRGITDPQSSLNMHNIDIPTTLPRTYQTRQRTAVFHGSSLTPWTRGTLSHLALPPSSDVSQQVAVGLAAAANVPSRFNVRPSDNFPKGIGQSSPGLGVLGQSRALTMRELHSKIRQVMTDAEKQSPTARLENMSSSLRTNTPTSKSRRTQPPHQSTASTRSQKDSVIPTGSDASYLPLIVTRATKKQLSVDALGHATASLAKVRAALKLGSGGGAGEYSADPGARYLLSKTDRCLIGKIAQAVAPTDTNQPSGIVSLPPLTAGHSSSLSSSSLHPPGRTTSRYDNHFSSAQTVQSKKQINPSLKRSISLCSTSRLPGNQLRKVDQSRMTSSQTNLAEATSSIWHSRNHPCKRSLHEWISALQREQPPSGLPIAYHDAPN